MVDNDDARLNHILYAAEEIERFLSGKNEVEFCNDRLLLLGIQKLIEIIGEAVSRLSDSLKNNYPAVNWRSAVSTRNRLSHGYFDVNASVIWSTATQDIPVFAEEVRAVLQHRSAGL